MSRLEIILVTALVCIVAGAGAVYWQRSHQPTPQPVAAPAKPQEQATEQQPRQMTKEQNKAYWALKDCKAVLERALSFSQHCVTVWEKQREHGEELTAATLKYIKSQSAQDKAMVDRIESQGKTIDRDRQECTKVQSKIESVKNFDLLIKAGRIDEAERLCSEAGRAIPAGF